MNPELDDINLSTVDKILQDAETEYSKAEDKAEYLTRSSFQTLMRFFLLTNANGARIKAYCDKRNLPEPLRNKLLLIHFIEECIKEQKAKSEQSEKSEQ